MRPYSTALAVLYGVAALGLGGAAQAQQGNYYGPGWHGGWGWGGWGGCGWGVRSVGFRVR